MTSSSPRPAPLRELRTGTWTRLGDPGILGDPVTEDMLDGLAGQAQAAAQAQGYSRGWAQGRRAAEQHAAELTAEVEQRHRTAELRREAEHQAVLDRLLQATARLDESLAQTLAAVEDAALQLAVSLAETLVGHELRIAQQPGLDAVRRALASAPDEPLVSVRVSPEDLTVELSQLCGAATVVTDSALTRGDAVVETRHGVVDARIGAAVSRVRELLP